MAQRRMFSPKIVGSDAFLDMPTSARELYFQLGMYADDDGFINPRKIIRMVGASEDDLKIIIAKRFVIPFENGVVVIKHWAINNLIRKDWYQETIYTEQKKLLKIKENGAYTEFVNNPLTQYRLGKDRLGKDREEGEETPAQKAKKFFNDQEPIIQELIAKGIPETVVRQEIQKFVRYWTELNKTGKQQKWEKQETFEVNKRLATWFGNISEFKKAPNPNVGYLHDGQKVVKRFGRWELPGEPEAKLDPRYYPEIARDEVLHEPPVKTLPLIKQNESETRGGGLTKILS